jgi:hypothetical protein
MKKILIALLGFSIAVFAEGNTTAVKTVEKKRDSNTTQKAERKKSVVEEQIKKQMEREEKYAKEQKFYQGDEYDLDAHKVDPKTIEKVPAIEPEYDFDMTDVYSD